MINNKLDGEIVVPKNKCYDVCFRGVGKQPLELAMQYMKERLQLIKGRK